MRVDTLHRRIVDDVCVLHDVVDHLFPAIMPVRYERQALNLGLFLKRINTVTEPLGVFNEIKPDMSVGLSYLSGLWIGYDELPENGSNADIRVLWHLHPRTKLVRLTQPEWSRRRFYFWQMVMHELVHRHQDVYRTADHGIKIYRPRSTERDVKEEQEYYGNFDEIEAHSHDAAVELLTWWGHLSLREAIHEAVTYAGRLITPTYCFYAATYVNTPGHPAMKHFKRKLRAWYDVIRKNPELYQLLELPNLVS